MEDEFELPDSLSHALAGNTRGLSFSSATWGVRFPSVDDLATLPRNARYVGLGEAPKSLELLRRATRLVAIKAISTTSDVVNELQHVRTLRMAVLITLKLTDDGLRHSSVAKNSSTLHSSTRRPSQTSGSWPICLNFTLSISTTFRGSTSRTSLPCLCFENSCLMAVFTRR